MKYFYHSEVNSITTKWIMILLLLVGTVLIDPATALAEINWPATAANVSNTYDIDSVSPVVASDPNGNPVAIWNENYKINAAKYYGGWKPSVKISTGSAIAQTPAITSDKYGLYAVWDEMFSGNHEIAFSRSLDGSTWSAPVNISGSNLIVSTQPDIMIGGDGSLYLVWNEGGNIYFRRSTDRGVSWGAKINIGYTGGCSEPSITIDSSGVLHAVWQNYFKVDEEPETYNYEIFYQSSDNNGIEWTTPLNISGSPSHASQYPEIAVDFSSNIFVVWEEELSTANTEIFLCQKASGWYTPQSMSPSTPERHDRDPAIIYSRAGEIRLIWSHWQGVSASEDRDIYGRTYKNKTWTNTTLVSDTTGISNYPAINDNGSGNAVVVWQDATANPAHFEINSAMTTGSFTLLDEDFEVEVLGNTGSPWSVGDDRTASTNGLVYWDEITWTSRSGTKSAWCAGVNGDLTTHRYKPDMSAFMKITLDLRYYQDALLSYYWKLPSGEASGSWASDVGTVKTLSGSSLLQDYTHNEVGTVWAQNTIDLTPSCGKIVTIDWRWVSDDSDQGEGLYIDDVLVTGNVKQPSDSIAPAAVADLSAGTPTADSLKLTWTAPGDDAKDGTAFAYDIRYSSASINTTNWGQATQATGEPTPKSGGSSESLIVTGLNSNTKYYFAIKSVDDNSNWSELSNVPSATTASPADLTAPASITDLRVMTASLNGITLGWTATGDDGQNGTATTYDIRYSTSLINESNWAAATQAIGEPAPKVSGSPETFSISNLSPASNYYFAIKAIDDNSNTSSLSNVPLGQTTTMQGDINRDRVVDIFDLVIVGKAFGSAPGQPNWNSVADLNSDNVIDIFDLVIVGKNFGKSI